MKPQTSEQNGSAQNGDPAADAASVATEAAATIPTGAAASADVAIAGAVVPVTGAKSSQQLKLEMLNMELASNGSGECPGRVIENAWIPESVTCSCDTH